MPNWFVVDTQRSTSEVQGLSLCTLHFELGTELVPEVGIAPTSPPLQGGANLPQLLGVKMVVPRGNAPRSSAYQADALLLSYRTENGSRGDRWRTPLEA